MKRKLDALERAKKLFEEGKVVIPSHFLVEELVRWEPESDASLALRYALGSDTGWRQARG